MRAVAAERELHLGLEEKPLVTQRRLPAENPIIRAAPQCEIMTVNPALRCARYLHFLELLFDPAGPARRKFYSAECHRGDGQIRFVNFHPRILCVLEIYRPAPADFLVKKNKSPHERNVPQTRLAPAVDLKTFRPLERAIN